MKQYTLISGATGGLGGAFVLDAARRGHDLLLTDTSEEKLHELAKSIMGAYAINVLTFTCNLTEIKEREGLFNYINENGIELFLTINVAGLDYEGETVLLTSEKISTIIKLNVESTLDICRFVAANNALKNFYIINVASMAGFYPMPYKATYSASKAAILSFSLALRQEIKNDGGHVLALCPSGLRTNPSVCEKIDSQGFLGRITTIDTSIVARKTINKALKNRSHFIPGSVNQFLVGISSILSRDAKAKLIHKRWTSNLKKSVHSSRSMHIL